MSAALSSLSSTTTQSGPRHFLDLKDLDATTLRQILDVAAGMKQMQKGRRFPLHPRVPLAGRALGIILSKPSTRTRVSFEVGIRQLGGDAVILSPSDMQIGRGETITDTARVLSRFVDALVLRTGRTENLHELARAASVPVINGLTPSSHPVQILADILTYEEHRGPVKGRTFAWTGDGNNVLVSLIEGAVRFGFKLRAATPADMAPPQAVLDWARQEGGDVVLTTDPRAAVDGADCVVTDTWLSMSDSEEEAAMRLAKLSPYRVDAA